MPALTEKDLEDLKLALELHVDWIALSFVRQPEDIESLQNRLGDIEE
jgi:pyruvate kinase